VVVANGTGNGADLLGLAVGTHTGDDADDGESGEGDDVLSDVENIIGGSGADELVGSTGPNTITGGDGADVISGGDGGNCTTDIDVLNGGNHDDVFMMGPDPDCGDTVNGGAGTDRVDYQYRTAILRISVNNAADDGDDNDNNGTTDEGDNIKNDVEQIFGGSANDVIVGGTGNDDLRGGAGNDTLSGGGGNDTLVGHSGDDVLNGDAGDDVFPCEGEDTDYISHAEADRAKGAGMDIINGGAGSRDQVSYEGRTDPVAVTMCQDTSALQGSSDDTEPAGCVDLDGTMDAPVLTGTVDLTSGAPGGAAGAVTIEFLGNTYPVVWVGTENLVQFEALFDAALTGSGLVASVDGTPALVLTPDLAPGDLSINVTGAENEAVFGASNTSTTAAPEGDELVNVEWGIGGDGADIMVGSAAADTLEGRGGADTISGGAGNDTLYGDDGLDNLSGGAGDDTLDGGNDADNDVLDGGEGDGDMCVVTASDAPTACEIE
jgi:Ca2+-binding RTX toxin-like protein